MAKRFSVLIALLMLGFFVAGCADGDKSATTVNPNPDVFSPEGSISGIVYDYCTEVPVKGAVVSVAYKGRVHSVTTASNGAYSFNDVPANGYGGYSVSCDLTKVTGYGYAMVENVYVGFTDLDDGNNSDLSDADGTTEAGSGASTPVDNLASNLNFTPGPLTSGLSGTIYDVSTGRAVSGATVALYQGSTYRTAVTSTDGTYSFANIMPGATYGLMVTKAGYDYAALQAANTVGSPECNVVDVACAIGCGQVKTGVNVNMIANPAKDMTIPYIVSFAAGAETDVIDDDVFPTLTPADITTLVARFSEGMQVSRSLKNSVILTATSAVTVTSGGVGATLEATLPAGTSIISDYTVTMTSAGIMTITPELLTAADFAALAGYGSTATFTYDGAATYTVTFAPGAHLTDSSLNMWTIGTPGAVDALGFLHAWGEAYQDYFILGGIPGTPSYDIAIEIGE